jgi:hypothetical protein
MKSIFCYASRAQYTKMVKDSNTVIKSAPAYLVTTTKDMY